MSTSSPRSRSRGLQTKTLAALLAVIVLTGLTLNVPMRMTIRGSFEEIEQRNAARNVARLRVALNMLLDDLSRTVGDYARWDDTHTFMVERDPDYLENYTADSLAALDIDLIGLIATNNELIFGAAYDDASGETAELPASLLGRYRSQLTVLPETTSVVSGLAFIEDRPLLIATRPVVTTAGTGPINGTLLMGRWLDQDSIATLEQSTLQPITLFSLADPTLPTTITALRTRFEASQDALVEPLDAQTIAGFTQLSDLQGMPTLVAQVTLPRDISETMRGTIRLINAIQFFAALVLCFSMIWIIRWLVLSRLMRLNHNVQEIKQAHAATAQVPVEGRDEIGQLAAEINAMLASIAKAEAQSEASARETQALQQRIIEGQSASLAKLSAPLIPVSHDVLVLPVIGMLDQQRANQMTQTLLTGLTERRAHTAIVDVTGLDMANGDVAHLLLRMAQATQLIGARFMLTGIRASLARELAALDIPIEEINTYGTLQQAITAALHS